MSRRRQTKKKKEREKESKSHPSNETRQLVRNGRKEERERNNDLHGVVIEQPLFDVLLQILGVGGMAARRHRGQSLREKATSSTSQHSMHSIMEI